MEGSGRENVWGMVGCLGEGGLGVMAVWVGVV